MNGGAGGMTKKWGLTAVVLVEQKLRHKYAAFFLLAEG